MKVLDLRVFAAIKAGDMKTLRQIFDTSTETEVSELLATRQEESAMVRRPSNSKEVYIRRPTLLVSASAEWYTEILDYLLEIGPKLADQGCTVDDITNTPHVYDEVTPLHVCSITGKLKMVQSLLKHGACANAQNSLGDTPLFEACFEGHLTVVQELIRNGADVTVKSNRHVTCLMMAAYSDNMEIVEYLVFQKAQLDTRDLDGRNVLFYAVAGGSIGALKFLLDRGVKPANDHHNVNILMEAVHQRRIDIIRYITQNQYALDIGLHDLDSSGRNVLFYTSEHDNTDVLVFLLKFGIPVSPSDDGKTLLMVALLKGSFSCVRYLVDNSAKLGVSLNAVDDKGRNCLFYCITGGDVDTFLRLLSAGVTITPSADGISLLMQAVAKARHDFVEHLLESQASYRIKINDRDKDGWNALMYAVAGGHLDLFKLLLQSGAECLPADDGRSVLMQAAAKGDVLFLRHLVNNAKPLNIYVNQRDLDGWNALFYTIQGKSLSLVLWQLHEWGN
jgi:ankyrin repeat protein